MNLLTKNNPEVTCKSSCGQTHLRRERIGMGEWFGKSFLISLWHTEFSCVGGGISGCCLSISTPNPWSGSCAWGDSAAKLGNIWKNHLFQNLAGNRGKRDFPSHQSDSELRIFKEGHYKPLPRIFEYPPEVLLDSRKITQTSDPDKLLLWRSRLGSFQQWRQSRVS